MDIKILIKIIYHVVAIADDMYDLICHLYFEFKYEIILMFSLFAISIFKYLINSLIFIKFPKIEKEQNNYKSERQINLDAIEYINKNCNIILVIIFICLFIIINFIINKKHFINILYIYSNIIGILIILILLISKISHNNKKCRLFIENAFQVLKDILSLLILKSLVYSQFTSEKLFKEYGRCVLYYIKFYFTFLLFAIIYSFFIDYLYLNRLITYIICLFILYLINIFISFIDKNQNSLKYSYMSIANISALLFVLSAIFNVINIREICMCYNNNILLTNDENCINLIILMAINYRCKKYFSKK